jgi:hypothetical protein
MITIVAPLIVLVLGVLVYALAANGKVQELGRLAYFVGLFWAVAASISASIRALGLG